MQLNNAGLLNRKEWEQAGYRLPQYDREAMIKNTKEHPDWIHFGAGNIFRAFPANVVENLLNKGIVSRGLIVAEGFDYEIIEKIHLPFDGYSILATLKSNGSIEKTVVGSIAEALILDSEYEKDFTRLIEIFQNPSLTMASFTITEKGYNLKNADNEWLPPVSYDMEHGTRNPKSYIGKVASLLYQRFLAGSLPIAMVSMDNCSHNGTKLYDAITAYAEQWSNRGLVEPAFYDYVTNQTLVSFPWTMIDKITPRPDKMVEKLLCSDGIENLSPIITSKNTYVAPFVNAEECEYMVIEDSFPNKRPPLKQGGLLFTNRETVDKVEKMKVGTCLNPLHTALAIFGCLLNYTLISEEMKDPALVKLVEEIGYLEGLPVVINPVIMNPEEFLKTVLTIRIPNPFLPDTPQRIATDTSQKLAIRFGETIKAYNRSENLKVSSLKRIPLVFAGWLRYLMGIDDNGRTFELSPDPLLSTLRPYVVSIKLGDKINAEEVLEPILKNETIFGVDLYEVGLASVVCEYFEQMTQGPGAVRGVLQRVLLENGELS
jgi:fructuronate reductase